ncbi:MAG TPA: thioredoxin domain-containing protein [Chitinophagaceae bacterium]|nr:thioredoxin domain-containing protein [Chitinophagaceae bacterium]
MSSKKEVLEIIQPKDVFVGNPDAKVVLMEYGEYESEECARVNEVVKKLLQEYEGKIRFNFRHFPLTQIHQRSQKAAEAAVAAAQEGKFWEMHNLLFSHRRNLGVISLKEYARTAGVTDKHFLTRMVDSAYGWTVRADLLDGLDKGIRKVPVFFINGERFTDAPTYKNLRAAVEQALQHARKKTGNRQRA